MVGIIYVIRICILLPNPKTDPIFMILDSVRELKSVSSILTGGLSARRISPRQSHCFCRNGPGHLTLTYYSIWGWCEREDTRDSTVYGVNLVTTSFGTSLNHVPSLMHIVLNWTNFLQTDGLQFCNVLQNATILPVSYIALKCCIVIKLVDWVGV